MIQKARQGSHFQKTALLPRPRPLTVVVGNFSLVIVSKCQVICTSVDLESFILATPFDPSLLHLFVSSLLAILTAIDDF